jgi:hypothetical protein
MSELLGLLTPGPFYALALLACPVGMGVMMWFMMRGGRQGQQMGQSSKPMESSTDLERETELARLRAEIDEIRAKQTERDSELSTERK